jgi:1,4-alpha-glucan branching enzyme
VPLAATLNFLHNHDQIGNRAFGERLVALVDEAPMRLAVAVMLLAPAPCMLFMGEERGATTPFLYFADWSGELRRAVTEGRRREFAHFPQFADPATRDAIPDPCDAHTLARSTLDWNALRHGVHARWQAFYGALLALRRERLWPVLPRLQGPHAAERVGARGLAVRWAFQRADGADPDALLLFANCGTEALDLTLPLAAGATPASASSLAGTGSGLRAGNTLYVLGDVERDRLGPWSARWSWHAAGSRP